MTNFSKVLVVFIVVLSGYMLFDMLSSDERKVTKNGDDVVLAPTVEPSIQLSTKAKKNSVKPEVLYEIDPGEIPETTQFESEFIDATYTANLNNDHIKATLNFTFKEDGTFTDYRDMTFPRSVAGEATGTYTIEGASVNLEYSEQRDTEVFKFSKSKMSLHKDGTLRTGTVVLTKQ